MTKLLFSKKDSMGLPQRGFLKVSLVVCSSYGLIVTVFALLGVA